MGKIREWLKKKQEKKHESYMATDFYLMLSYYDIRSLNVAVIGNKKKYKWVITNELQKMKEHKSIYNRVIKKSDNHYLFLKQEQEVNYIHIEDVVRELPEYNKKYRKYM